METDCSYSKSMTWNSSHPPRHFPPSSLKLAIYDQGGETELNGTKLRRQKRGICLRDGDCNIGVGQCYYKGMWSLREKAGVQIYMTLYPMSKHAWVRWGGVDVTPQLLSFDSLHVLLPFSTQMNVGGRFIFCHKTQTAVNTIFWREIL